jgi:tryptophanyl-tRNA synthetase
MSSSDENSYIALTDTPEIVERKIKRYAFSGGRESLEEHRKKGGDPDKDVSFQYLKMFFESDDKKLNQIYEDYKSGKMFTSELKNITIEKINEFLKGHQKKLKLAGKMVGKFL